MDFQLCLFWPWVMGIVKKKYALDPKNFIPSFDGLNVIRGYQPFLNALNLPHGSEKRVIANIAVDRIKHQLELMDISCVKGYSTGPDGVNVSYKNLDGYDNSF